MPKAETGERHTGSAQLAHRSHPARQAGRRPDLAPARAARPASVTVVGRSLTAVDVDATAAFALGADGERWLAARATFVVRTDETTGTL